MSAVSSADESNLLIDGLPHKERNQILECCEPVELAFGAVLSESNRPLQHVYFPVFGFISLVATVHRHPPLVVGFIGREGMLGATLALGIGAAPLRGVVHGPGTALRMTAAQLRRELQNNPGLFRRVNRYVYDSMAQFAQTAVCNRFHEVEARLSRWLLMAHDRAQADEFHLTHQLLADMLGVQRGAVTIAAGALQRQRLIRYTHGRISIVSRKGLEAASCECYEAGIREHDRAFA